jgi:hypothetical protein
VDVKIKKVWGGLNLLLLLAFVSPLHANEQPRGLQVSDNNYDFCSQLGRLDKPYCHLNYGIDSAANGINSWFKHEGGDQDTNATTRGRLRFGWEPRSGDLSEIDFRFRIRVKLPALQDRVELFLSDQDDGINQQEIKAARSEELGNRDQTVLALQFKKKAEDKVSYRIGFGRGSQLYTRARYSDKLTFSDEASIHYFAETNYYSSDQLGFEANAEFGYVFDSRSAFEINNSFRYRHKSKDWLWRHEIQYLYVGENETSYLFSAMIDGLSEPSYRKEQMLISVRYKRKILKEWLFIEVEPFILWLREEDFRSSPGIAIRAEVHFST